MFHGVISYWINHKNNNLNHLLFFDLFGARASVTQLTLADAFLGILLDTAAPSGVVASFI